MLTLVPQTTPQVHDHKPSINVLVITLQTIIAQKTNLQQIAQQLVQMVGSLAPLPQLVAKVVLNVLKKIAEQTTTATAHQTAQLSQV